MKRRVVITGIGVITGLGVEVEEFWRACLDAKTRVEPIPEAWGACSDYHSRIWSPLPELDWAAHGITRVEQFQNDPATLIGMAAAAQALDQAGLEREQANVKRNTFRLKNVEPRRVMVAMGTGVGGVGTLMTSLLHHVLTRPKQLLEEALARPGDLEELLGKIASGLRLSGRLNPLSVPMAMPNAAASALSIKFSLQGPSNAFCSACAAGAVAVGQAFRAIRAGRADLALAGGTEFFDDPHGAVFRGFDLAGALVRNCDKPDAANRPFDRDRSGFLFSQGGAAVLVLEELDRARRRGARALAEVVGFAETCDAHNIVAMEPQGLEIARAVREALEDASLPPQEIDYVNAHGTGTAANDETEVAVLEEIFGRRPLVNSTKSLLGHTVGASGAIETAVAALSLRDQTTHVCRNLHNPIGDLNFVIGKQPFPIRAAITQSFAFGGHNAVLALRQAPPT